MHWQDLQSMPILVPIRRGKRQFRRQDSKEYEHKQLSIPSKDTQKKSNLHEDKKNRDKNGKSIVDSQIIEQIDNKFKNVHDQLNKHQIKQLKSSDNKSEQNSHSKFTITRMMHKIEAKNITEELNPITNQKIKDIVDKVNDEVNTLEQQVEQKQSLLLSNSNNQQLKRQIYSVKVLLERCIIIRQLYNQKINIRNKISVLEADLIHLRDQNRNLQIKISKGLEDAQNHKQGRPCEAQSMLSQKLKICEAELTKERTIKQQLSSNVSQILMNFNKLYTEAETARLIVSQKLKELQKREKQLTEIHTYNQQKLAAPQKLSPQQEVLIERNRKSIRNSTKFNAPNSATPQKNTKYTKISSHQQPNHLPNLQEQIKKILSQPNQISRSIAY